MSIELVDEFGVLFHNHWCERFPVDNEEGIDTTNRATLTIYTASVVRRVADNLGLYCTHETGDQTDAELHELLIDGDDYSRSVVARVEWEWNARTANHQGWLHELEQLRGWAEDQEWHNRDTFACLIQYSDIVTGVGQTGYTHDVAMMTRNWTPMVPLLNICITYQLVGNVRWFEDMYVNKIRARTLVAGSKRESLPWKKRGRRWSQLN